MPCAGNIDETTVRDLVRGTDLILDGLDNFAARYLVNRAGLDEKIPFIHGAANGFYGQVTTIIPGSYPVPAVHRSQFPFVGKESDHWCNLRRDWLHRGNRSDQISHRDR